MGTWQRLVNIRTNMQGDENMKLKNDIMINNYNYSADVRAWEAKHGSRVFSEGFDQVAYMRCSMMRTESE